MPYVFSWLKALILFLCSGKSLLPMLATCLSSLIYSLREYSTQLPPFFLCGGFLIWAFPFPLLFSSLSVCVCLCLDLSISFVSIPIRSFADGFCVYAWILLFFFTQTGYRVAKTVECCCLSLHDWYGSTLYELQSVLGQIEKKKGKALYTMNNMSFTKAKRRSSIFHIPNTALSNNYTLKKERRNHKVNNQVAASTNRFRKDPMMINLHKLQGSPCVGTGMGTLLNLLSAHSFHVN
ncbi:hypothetical protein DVH24_004182 [Malus domestica]|uniref:Uncharacterized protein n=1 Tax=Malus domestica TaxID=3750 RepID=A0A498K5K7_MALDO|nr:hypothetical protein DVH24_004182 [Malus domestica]